MAFDDALRHHFAGRIEQAITGYRAVLTLNPDHGDAHNNLGIALVARGRTVEAIAHYERAIALDPRRADTHYNLGIAFNALGKTEEAALGYQRALLLKPDYAEAHNNLGTILLDKGHLKEATVHYDRAIAIRPDYPQAHFNRAEIRTFRNGDSELEALEILARRSGVAADEAAYIHFALGKALDDCGDHKRAFEQWTLGNVLKRRGIHYNEPATFDFFDRIAAAFDSSSLARFGGDGNPSRVPIFVVGMPRSGTTLVEQILAGHSAIQGAGELTHLAEHGCRTPYPGSIPALDRATAERMAQTYLLRLPALEPGKSRIVNKLPDNFLRIGLIRIILPNARIIHVRRNPVDTCISCYSKLFANGQHFSYDLAELGRYYRRYLHLMKHWRSVLPGEAMLDVDYEDVVDDLEGQARRLVEYCGLPWDDRCLDFHKTSRPVRTASAVQVRRPLFRSSLQRWRRYESGIGPLIEALGDALPCDRLDEAA